MPDHPDGMLVVERGISDVSVIPLDQDVILLGKSSNAGIVLDNPYVSRQHAQIVRHEGRFLIRDLGSKNGTFVNGSQVGNEGQQLQSGDRVDLAPEQVVLRFQQWGTTMTMPAIPTAGAGDLVVDDRSREVRIHGNRVDPPLSRKEFDVLALLYQRQGEACSKDDVAIAGWPDRQDGDVGNQEIEQCIRRLRLRIEPDPSQPRYLLTVRGYGYKLSIG